MVIFPIFLGGFIYIIYRPKSLLLFDWFDNLNIILQVDFLRANLGFVRFPEWFIYSLPNGLWSFSAISFVLIFSLKNKFRICWIIIFLCIIFLPEILQLSILEGTFDLIDIITNLFFSVFAFYINYKRSWNNEKVSCK